MTETKVKLKQELICEECDCELYTCDSCSDYFQEGKLIICENGEHYCKECNDSYEK